MSHIGGVSTVEVSRRADSTSLEAIGLRLGRSPSTCVYITLFEPHMLPSK